MKSPRRRRYNSLGTLLSVTGSAVLLAATIAPAVQARNAHQLSFTGRYGGSISVRLFAPPGCLDPLKPGGSIVAPVWAELFDTLVSIDGRGKIWPDLATKWTYSHGGKWVTFALRQGVRFSNGHSFDASSVRAMFNAELKLGPAFINIGPIQQVRVLDKHRVLFILSSPFESFLTGITSVPIADLRSDRQEGNRSCGFPIGTGAYKTQSVGPANLTIAVVRNSLHRWNPPWMHQGPGFLSKIVFSTVASDSTAVSQLLSGELDETNLPGSELGRVQGDSSITQHRFLAFLVQYLGFNTAKPPLNRASVRKAIAESIDRGALVKLVLRGLGRPAYSVTGPTNPFSDPQGRQYASRYDPAGARKVLAANHATGPFKLVVFGLPIFRVAAEVIQADLAQVGVGVTITVLPLPDAMAAYARGQDDMFMQVSPGTNYENIGLPGPVNATFYRNANLIRLINRFQRTIDRSTARRLAIQIQRIVNKNVVVDPLFTQVNVLAARSRIKGWHKGYFDLLPVLRDLYLAT